MSRKKANIRPDLMGELFLKPGEDVPYRLILCNTEPTAQIQRVDRTTPDDLVGISGLSGLVLLKPVRPIEKPKKPRADLGKTHKKQAPTPSDVPLVPRKRQSKAKHAQKDDVPEIADKKGDNLTIHVPTGLEGDTEYRVNIAGSEASGPESLGLRVVVLAALEEWSGKIPDELNDYERKTLQGILDTGE